MLTSTRPPQSSPSGNPHPQPSPRRYSRPRLILCLLVVIVFTIGIPLVQILSNLRIISDFWTMALSTFLNTWGFYASLGAMIVAILPDAWSRLKAFMTSPPAAINRGSGRRAKKGHVLAIVLVFLFGMPATIWYAYQPHDPCNTQWTWRFSSPGQDNSVVASNETCIGMSDGKIAFDWDMKDRPANYSSLKTQIMGKLKAGDLQGAKDNARTANAPNDAEIQIYLQDQEIMAKNDSSNYVTFVVATILEGDYLGGSRDILQGVAVAQKEYNQSCRLKNCMKVRILIANTSPDPNDATSVAKWIAQLAKTDKTIVGVIGWPLSQHSIDAVTYLSGAQIPLVSPTASDPSLRGKSRYFFSIAPSNTREGLIAARYAQQKLQAQRVVVFVDPNNAYSRSLADAFVANMPAGSIIATQTYEVGQAETIKEAWQRTAHSAISQADIIFFAGYASDASTLLPLLPPCQPSASTCLQVLGGDALYVVGDYTKDALSNFYRLNFTAFAYPDMWSIAQLQAPAFFCEYAQQFDDKQAHSSPYGYTRPDGDATLAYDATYVLLSAYNNALLKLPSETSRPTASDVQQSLLQINESGPLQGASGRIAFASDNASDDSKIIVTLYVDKAGYIHQQPGYDGQLLASHQASYASCIA